MAKNLISHPYLDLIMHTSSFQTLKLTKQPKELYKTYTKSLGLIPELLEGDSEGVWRGGGQKPFLNTSLSESDDHDTWELCFKHYREK